MTLGPTTTLVLPAPVTVPSPDAPTVTLSAADADRVVVVPVGAELDVSLAASAFAVPAPMKAGATDGQLDLVTQSTAGGVGMFMFTARSPGHNVLVSNAPRPCDPACPAGTAVVQAWRVEIVVTP